MGTASNNILGTTDWEERTGFSYLNFEYYDLATQLLTHKERDFNVGLF